MTRSVLLMVDVCLSLMCFLGTLVEILVDDSMLLMIDIFSSLSQHPTKNSSDENG